MSESLDHYRRGLDLLAKSQDGKLVGVPTEARILWATQATAYFSAAAALAEVNWEQTREQLRSQSSQDQARDDLVVDSLRKQATGGGSDG